MLQCLHLYFTVRIAFFSDNFYPEISGIADAILSLASELEKRGHAVCFVSPHYTEANFAKANVFLKAPPGVKREQIKTLPSIPYLGSPTSQGRIAIPIGFSYSFIKKFKPDVLHVQSPFGVGLEALLIAKILKIPVVGTNHTPIEEFMAYSPIHGLGFTTLLRRYFSWFYNRCRFITAPCAYLLRRMETVGLRTPNKALSNPLDLSEFSTPTVSEKETLKNELGFSSPVVLVSGRLAPEKNIDVVIRSFKQIIEKIPTATLVITGHGTSEEKLKMLAMELGIETNIRFLGSVARESLPHIYRASDVFVVASTAETQCLALMKGFASGLPAVGVRAQGLPEYIPEEAGFLIDPGDEKALAEKILYLIENPQIADHMGQAGQDFVQQFSAEQIAAEWEKIYSNFV
jgi:1,2-diacylglycerol 3-alpha-glucosyltransferase